jgi:O-antigen/teichoic acid export membrane protein
MLVLVTAMGAVMLPRLANLLGNDKKEEYERYMDKSLKYILMVAVPATVLFMVLAKEIMLVMAGDKFIPSIRTMQIIAPIIFIVALAYYVGFQVLYPLGKERIYTFSVTIAAVVNLVFNLFAIRHMKQDGAALGTLIAEIVGLGIMIYATRDKLAETGFFRANNLKYIAAGVLMAVAAHFSTYFNLEPIFTLLVSVSIGMAVYTLALFAMKEVIVYEVLAMAKGFFKK